jgi:signal transduction histidine kinase
MIRLPRLHVSSIRHKLNWVVLATTFVALSLAGLSMVIFDLRSYQRTWEDDLQSQADLIGLATAPALSFNDPKTARENLALLKVRPTISAAAIFTPQGEVFATYPPRIAIGTAPPPVDGVRVENGELVAVKRIVSGGEFLGTVYLRAHHERLDRLQQYLIVVGMVIAGSLALALLLSNRLLLMVTRPIQAVSDVARRMTAGHDYSLRAVRTTNDEVGQVVEAFNEMLDELARRADRLERVHQQTLDLNSQLEDRVRQRTVQLEVANRELEAFSYSASHDLRAPLHAIESFSSILARSAAAQQLDERSRHYLDRIQVNARLMNDLIEALLVLAHVSRAPLERQTIDMSAVIEAAVDHCRGLEPERRAVIDIASGMHAKADPVLVKQVVQNLVGNAWKFTAKEPVTKIDVGWVNGGDRPATFYVRDNGAGFDMAYADRLFSAFQRLHTPGEFPGTGIGLATVHRIVARHEGRIWAESVPGKGAAFYFTLDKA